MSHWNADDVRVVADIVAGSLLASLLRLIVLKAFLEPAAMWAGQFAYRRADAVLGDRLPDLFTPDHQSPET